MSELPGIRTHSSSRDALAQACPAGLELPLAHCGKRPSQSQVCLPRSEVGGIHPALAWGTALQYDPSRESPRCQAWGSSPGD